MDDSDPTVPRERVEELAAAGKLLGRRRRLYALLGLREWHRPLTLDELTQEVCHREFGEETVPEERRKEIRLTLVHNHLPKLEAAGVVDWDPEDREVRLLGDPTVESVVDIVFDA